MKADEIKQQLDTLVGEFKDTKAMIDELSDWDTFAEIKRNARQIFVFMSNVSLFSKHLIISAGEAINEENMEATVRWLDDLIKLNPFLEMVDDDIIRFVLNGVDGLLEELFGEETVNETINSIGTTSRSASPASELVSDIALPLDLLKTRVA